VIRRNSIAVLVAALLGVAAVWLASLRTAIPPVKRPASQNFGVESIVRGAALAAAGHCASCHTRPGGPEFAGG